MDEDLLAFGLGDQIRQRNTVPLGIWPENWIVVRAFMDLCGSWVRVTTADDQTGMEIDRLKIKCTLELMGVKRREWPDVFNGLKVMESAVLLALYGETE